MHTRGAFGLLLAGVIALGGGVAAAQHPPVHYTRVQLHTRCMEQCDRVQHACVDVMHRPAADCTRIDSTCRLTCNTRFPPPGGAPPAEIPIVGAP